MCKHTIRGSENHHFERWIQKVNTMFRMSMISPFDADHPETRDDFVINIEDSTNHMEVSSI